MSDASAPAATGTDPNKAMFWGCFVALVTTSFAFVGRLFLIDVWGEQFDLDPAQKGRLGGIGIWPFAVSIILFSLVIDKIGYKTAMFVAFLGHLIWTIMAVGAFFVAKTDTDTAYSMIYWGSLICALANGTVEAFINPVVATMFSKEKTKWLNILHAGWPAGLVITGLLLIGIDTYAADTPWAVKVGLIGIPTIIYFLMLVGLQFPQSERVTAGVSYREMLQEFGFLGAAIVGFLLVLQLIDFFTAGGTVEISSTLKYSFVGIGVAMVAAFGAYTRSIGRPLLLFLIVIMMPLATTEIGTDGWIESIMKGVAADEGFHSGWILVYTSAIMLILRFMAGPIVHSLSPLGLLAVSALLAAAGLTYLSTAAGFAIFIAATLYGFGKTFFWPTMLGVVSEQCPKGGALTLNAISGIGMLAVGTLGFPYIGSLQADKEIEAVVASEPAQKVDGLVEDGKLTTIEDKTIYSVIEYQAINDKALTAQIDEQYSDDSEEGQEVKAAIADVRSRSSQGALKDMAIFPIFMLVCYLILIFYFKAQGGYEAQVLVEHAAEDEKFTGGVAGAVE